uniref:glucuronosyltransferase n=1 Tax=Castor canadensis TaxID=51338 RepID=A0A8C0WEK5_CASCN
MVTETLHWTKMSMKWTSVLLLIQLTCYFTSGSCGKVVVLPMDYSHWMNIKTILDELVQRGHEVTVLTSSTSILVDPSKSSTIKFEVCPSSLNKTILEDLLKMLTDKFIYDFSKYSFWTYYSQLQKFFKDYSDVMETSCRDMVLNKELMTKLKESRFDVLLADAVVPCGELLAELLNIPFVYTLRGLPGNTHEKYSGGVPFPPSYVPVIMSELTDRMTFMERVKNMLYEVTCYITYTISSLSCLAHSFLDSGRPTTLFETMGKADIWLIRTYWDLEFPRPLLPNFVFVGGLQCKPAKPLPKEMEDFVQSSGENGVIVFSLGSMVSNMTEERANVIASVLAKIPQKVLWRYDGKKPDTLGSNTRIYEWIPQNDLLGHPKTKAFITHGGANGIYEAIHHGIPMVGIPLFGDQPDNIVRMKSKGAAVRLDFNTMSSTDLLNALETVINDPSYKENAMRLSRIHHDQPVKPLDQAVFWIEFVMRHKGAKHLRPAVHDLTWFQYHSLDVIGFLLACVATVTFTITRCCMFCCWKFIKTGKKKKGD